MPLLDLTMRGNVETKDLEVNESEEQEKTEAQPQEVLESYFIGSYDTFILSLLIDHVVKCIWEIHNTFV